VKTPGFLRFQARSDADFCLEKASKRAAGFPQACTAASNLALSAPGIFRHEVQMAFRDGEAIPDFFERNGCPLVSSLLAVIPGTRPQLGGKSHRKSTQRARRRGAPRGFVPTPFSNRVL